MFILWHGEFTDIAPAVEPLKKLRSHDEEFTRGMAAIALGGKGIKSSFSDLSKMTTGDNSPYARRCAAYALGLLGQSEARPILQKALTDSDTNVRNNAKGALEMLPDEE